MNINSSSRSIIDLVPHVLFNEPFQEHMLGTEGKREEYAAHNAQKITRYVKRVKKAPHAMLNPHNFRPTPINRNKGPTRSSPTEEGPERPQQWVGRPPGSPDPLLGPIRPIFLQQTPTALPMPAPDGSTSEVHIRISTWRAI